MKFVIMALCNRIQLKFEKDECKIIYMLYMNVYIFSKKKKEDYIHVTVGWKRVLHVRKCW